MTDMIVRSGKTENAVLTAVHIRKTYGRQNVLADASLDICRGEAVALVGENGCGKSTLLRILCGVTRPTQGTVTTSPLLRPSLIPDHFEKINMSVAHFLSYMCRLDNASPQTADHYCALFSMDAHLDTPLKYLSKGMLQKVAVIQALLGERDILFMDEPLSGQDAVSQLNFADEIRRRKEKGMAVVMACHEPFLIEALADRVLQIKGGVLIDGTDYLTRSQRPRCVALVVFDGTQDSLAALISRELPDAQPGFSACEQMLRIEAGRLHGPALLALLLKYGIRVVKYEEAL